MAKFAPKSDSALNVGGKEKANESERMRDLHREEEGRKGAQRGGVWGAVNHFRIDFQLDVNMLRVRGGRGKGRERKEVRSSLKS